MGLPAAKQNDTIVAVDTHIVMVPSPGGPVPTPLPHPFNAMIGESLSTDVYIDHRAAAVVGSVARTSMLQHPPTPPGTSFQAPPTFQGQITMGSMSVFINGKAAARAGDPAMTCNDIPIPPPGGGTVQVATSTVYIG